MVRYCAMCLIMLALVGRTPNVRAGFDLTFHLVGNFTATQRANLENAIDYAEALWEGVVTGYQQGINNGGIMVSVQPSSAIGLADALVTGSDMEAGFELTTSARIRVLPAAIDFWANWDGTGPNPSNTQFVGVNYLDDIMAHEVGHALGIGNQWVNNGVAIHGTGQYTGKHGLAAYRAEFDAAATFVPIERAGGPGRANFHWDQIVRSSSEEGVPADPWPLDPRLGITDVHGRDFAFDLMTATFDPDYGEPFLSRTTVQSLRDLGFTVVPEPRTTVLLLLGAMLIGCWDATAESRATP